jgi:tRNA-2-methylthio-N6-dimethylallyladenosine synthase
VARLQEINALVESTAKERNARYVGRIEQILAEGINAKDSSQLMGRTRTNRLTFFSADSPNGSKHRAGDLVDVRIDQVRSFSLTGTPVIN